MEPSDFTAAFSAPRAETSRRVKEKEEKRGVADKEESNNSTTTNSTNNVQATDGPRD